MGAAHREPALCRHSSEEGLHVCEISRTGLRPQADAVSASRIRVMSVQPLLWEAYP